jgi:hypothetical protein
VGKKYVSSLLESENGFDGFYLRTINIGVYSIAELVLRRSISKDIVITPQGAIKILVKICVFSLGMLKSDYQWYFVDYSVLAT